MFSCNVEKHEKEKLNLQLCFMLTLCVVITRPIICFSLLPLISYIQLLIHAEKNKDVPKFMLILCGHQQVYPVLVLVRNIKNYYFFL